MFCNNCGKEIGTQKECSFCGYRQDLSLTDQLAKGKYLSATLPKTEIKLLKTSNTYSKSGLVMSILSFFPIPFMILALVFNIKGTKRCKSCRSGKVRCVIAWIIFFFWIVLYGSVFSQYF